MVGLETLHPNLIATNSDVIASDDLFSFYPSRPRHIHGPIFDNRLNLIDQGGLRLATWNALTLNFPGAKSMLGLELKRFSVAVAAVTEARLIGNDYEDIGEGYHLIW